MNSKAFWRVLLALVLLPSCLYAQSGRVSGTVSEIVTDLGLPQTKVSLLRTDSTLIDTVRTETIRREYPLWNQFKAAPFSLACPAPGQYLLRFEREGYDTEVQAIDVHFDGRNRDFAVGDVKLSKTATQLHEAVVQATRIRMVYRGDTLVYNADAFRTPEGSMLEDLVRQLPGVEMRGDQVYVNGRYVENLLLNGKDFFNGNPQEALKRLPAYVVKDIKVYDKKGELSRTAGTDMGDDSYVMDVSLKREYHGVWTLMAYGGLATHDRYNFLANVMRIDDRSAFLLGSEMNNTGTSTEVYDDGGMSTSSWGTGLRARKNVNARYSFEPHDRLRFNANAAYTHTGNDIVDGTSSETYLAAGNTYGRSLVTTRETSDQVNGGLGLSLRPKEQQYFQFDYNADYTRNHTFADSRSASYSLRPDSLFTPDAVLDETFALSSTDRLRAAIVQNRLRNLRQENGRAFNQEAKFEMNFGLSPDLFNFEASLKHGTRSEESFEHYRAEYPASGDATDFRNRFRDNSGHNYAYKARADYYFKYAANDTVNAQLQPFYGYEQTYASAQNPLYRLDFLSAWGDSTTHALGALPSTTDSLQQAIDFANSYYSTSLQRTHTFGLSWMHEWRLGNHSWLQIKASAPVRVVNNKMDYNRNARDYHVSRNDWLFEPSASVRWRPYKDDRNGKKLTLQLSYDTKAEQPSLLHLIDVRDDSDPLNVSLGNADLKNTRTHTVQFGFSRPWSMTSPFFGSTFTYNRTQNAIGIASTYDRTTGIRTTRPVNVDGNWNAGWNGNLGLNLDKKQRYSLTFYASADYTNSVDLNTTTETATDALLSDVRTWHFSFQPNLNFQVSNNFGGYIYTKVEHQSITGTRSDFTSIHTTNYNVGGYLNFNLPFDINLFTNCYVQKRTGFSDPSLNTTRINWDASIGRNLWGEKLRVSLQAYDLLHQNDGIYNELNAQGRIERFRNVRPAYIELRLQFKLTTAKKHAEEE